MKVVEKKALVEGVMHMEKSLHQIVILRTEMVVWNGLPVVVNVMVPGNVPTEEDGYVRMFVGNVTLTVLFIVRTLILDILKIALSIFLVIVIVTVPGIVRQKMDNGFVLTSAARVTSEE